MTHFMAIWLLSGIALADPEDPPTDEATEEEAPTEDEGADEEEAPPPEDEGADEATEDADEESQDTDAAEDTPDTTTLPEGLEPGSTREVVVAKQGDTFNSIAMERGFLPFELAEWSGMPGHDVNAALEPGTEVVLWVAPIEVPPEEPEEEEEEEEKEKKPKKEPRDRGDRIGVVIGARVGPDFPILSPLKTYVLPGLEVGYILPVADGLIEVYGLAGYAAPPADGDGDDAGLAESFDYDIRQKQISLGLGARARFYELIGPMTLTASLGPEVELLQTVTTGSSGGEDFGENREQYTTVGFHVSPGLEYPLGPGGILFDLRFAWSPLTKVITGKSSTGRLTPQLGYRLMF